MLSTPSGRAGTDLPADTRTRTYQLHQHLLLETKVGRDWRMEKSGLFPVSKGSKKLQGKKKHGASKVSELSMGPQPSTRSGTVIRAQGGVPHYCLHSTSSAYQRPRSKAITVVFKSQCRFTKFVLIWILIISII